MKAIYINDCQYDFVDNEGQLIFSYRSNMPLTNLDIRKLQLASMIKGNWCENIDEINFYLSSLKNLAPYEIGILVQHFELFDVNSEKLILCLNNDCCEAISSIRISVDQDLSYFLITEFEKNETLSIPIRDFCKFGRILKWQGIKTVGDLVNITKSQLLSKHDIGISRANEIEQLLAEKNLKLKDE